MNRRHFLLNLGGIAGITAVNGLLPSASAAPKPGAPQEGSANQPAPVPRFGDGRDWFFQRRFGLFIHWGIYSIHAWHEQAQYRARMSRAEYNQFLTQWNPVHFNPEAWLDLAERAGMKYICLTTKHHDGFCLWDTKLTKFNTMNTPYGKDIVKQLADACHRRKMPLCLYYSIADWHEPTYPNQGRHHEIPAQPGDPVDWNRYMEFLKGQVRELCTNYGEIHGIWWDMNVPKHVDPSINEMIRKLQPNAVINDRGFDPGDFGTPERDYESKGEAGRPVEACQSVGSHSWGYGKTEDYYTDRYLCESIDRYLTKDANYLLNVGPMADGTIGPRETGILERIGTWYHSVKESLEGVTPFPHLAASAGVLFTRRDNTLYVHLNKPPQTEGVRLKPFQTAPVRATLLNNGQPVEFSVDMLPEDHMEQKAYLRLRHLPVNELSNNVLVIKLEFDPFPEMSDGAKAHSNDIRLR